MDALMKERAAGHNWATHPKVLQSNNPIIHFFPGNLLPPFLKE
jgi:hypothetical protein